MNPANAKRQRETPAENERKYSILETYITTGGFVYVTNPSGAFGAGERSSFVMSLWARSHVNPSKSQRHFTPQHVVCKPPTDPVYSNANNFAHTWTYQTRF